MKPHRVNARIAIELQESGVAAPSTTVIGGKLAIRAAIVNHRTEKRDLDALVERTVELGRKLSDRVAGACAQKLVDSTNWQPHLAREAALADMDACIAADPAAIEPRVERAGLLAELGRTLDARNAYLDVLARAPSHRLALNHLGTLLHSTGYRTAARTAFSEAAVRHPDDPLSRVNLANALFENREFEKAREHYEIALRREPDFPEAHQGLSYVLAELGDARLPRCIAARVSSNAVS